MNLKNLSAKLLATTLILKKGNLATYYGLTEASRSTFMIFDKNNHREESVNYFNRIGFKIISGPKPPAHVRLVFNLLGYKYS